MWLLSLLLSIASAISCYRIAKKMDWNLYVPVIAGLIFPVWTFIIYALLSGYTVLKK